MTLRERIADWISGGKLRDEKQRVIMLRKKLESALNSEGRKHDHLCHIIARGNTKAPNSTVRDMVRIAQEGLER